MTQLFATEAREKWAGSTELVPVSMLACIWCGPTFEVSYAQPALFRHGGYGATEGKRIRTCRCGAVFSVSKATLNPR